MANIEFTNKERSILCAAAKEVLTNPDIKYFFRDEEERDALSSALKKMQKR